MKMKKFTTFALAAAFTIGTFGISVPVKAAENSTDYTITIPATLTVEQKGWNATDGITAKVKSGDTFDSSKKLTVTAASANEWNLKSGENAIAYKMASATEQEKSYADATATTSLEISAEDLNTGNYEAPFGIVVEDYTDKPAGEYKDTVTFTASVVSATKKLKLTGRYFDYNSGDDVTKSLEIEYTDNDTWKDIAGRYNEVSLEDNSFGPEGKIVKFWADANNYGCELKSNESTYEYNLVSINDKVSAYSSYYLQGY
jgi:hypothetical protein